jgi:hypothetical protein
MKAPWITVALLPSADSIMGPRGIFPYRHDGTGGVARLERAPSRPPAFPCSRSLVVVPIDSFGPNHPQFPDLTQSLCLGSTWR